MSRRQHVLDVYDAELHLATTERQWAALVRRFEGALAAEDIASVGACAFTVDTSWTPHLVFWLHADLIGDNALGMVTTCAHEAAHGAAMLLDHVGQSYDGKSEALAYLVGWLTRWLIEGVEWKH